MRGSVPGAEVSTEQKISLLGQRWALEVHSGGVQTLAYNQDKLVLVAAVGKSIYGNMIGNLMTSRHFRERGGGLSS